MLGYDERRSYSLAVLRFGWSSLSLGTTYYECVRTRTVYARDALVIGIVVNLYDLIKNFFCVFFFWLLWFWELVEVLWGDVDVSPRPTRCFVARRRRCIFVLWAVTRNNYLLVWSVSTYWRTYCYVSTYWCDITARVTVGVLSFFGLRREIVLYWYHMSVRTGIPGNMTVVVRTRTSLRAVVSVRVFFVLCWRWMYGERWDGIFFL